MQQLHTALLHFLSLPGTLKNSSLFVGYSIGIRVFRLERSISNWVTGSELRVLVGSDFTSLE